MTNHNQPKIDVLKLLDHLANRAADKAYRAGVPLAEKREIVEARAAVAELIVAARALRGYVDVSTIRPGKKNAFEWGIRMDRIDAALAALNGEQA